MNTLKDDYLFKVVKEGGQSVGKSQLMPAWAAQIKDPDIWNTIAYIRTLVCQPTKVLEPPQAQRLPRRQLVRLRRVESSQHLIVCSVRHAHATPTLYESLS